MGIWNRNQSIIHLPKALLVDMDDTLLTYSAASESAWRAVCVKHAPQVGGAADAGDLQTAISAAGRRYWEDPERHRQGRLNLLMARRTVVSLALAALDSMGGFRTSGPSNPDSLDRIISKMIMDSFDPDNHRGTVPSISDNPVANDIADDYSILQYELLEWFPGAEKTLEQLCRDRIRLVLVTNGQAMLQRAKINRFHMERFFEAVLIEEEAGFGKPDPRIYRKALAGLSLQANDVRMVGDNLQWDVKGAQDAGMEGIWVDFRRKGLPVGSLIRPDRILTSISGLYDRDSGYH
jgi:putative hydrolase of the HAD superfamily